MRVLVLGATGFIGPPLISSLTRAGVEAIGASRGGGGSGAVALDRSVVTDVRQVVRERKVDVVIDLLGLTESAASPLFAALDGEIERLVLTSSCDVYRNYEGLHRRASPPPLTGLLQEASPLRETRYPYRASPPRSQDAPDRWLDDYDKIPIEIALRERPDLNGVILRLPMVYGPGDRQRRFRWLIGPMLRGAPELRLDPDWVRWRTSYGYVENIADALATAATRPDVGASTFNIGASTAPDHRQWIASFARILGWRGAVSPMPAPSDGPLAALDLSYPLTIDTRAFRAAYGWSEPVAAELALLRTVEDERRRR